MGGACMESVTLARQTEGPRFAAPGCCDTFLLHASGGEPSFHNSRSSRCAVFFVSETAWPRCRSRMFSRGAALSPRERSGIFACFLQSDLLLAGVFSDLRVDDFRAPENEELVRERVI